MRPLIAAALCFTATTALADPGEMSAMRKMYDNCVYEAAGSQWKANPSISPAVAAETAFVACTTEEQAILSYLYAMPGRPDVAQIQSVMAGVKLKLKQTIREIMSDPKGYLRRNGG